MCDREYTSYTLVQSVLEMGFYCIGTCCPSRLGFPLSIIWPKGQQPPRGAYSVAQDNDDPRISAVSWRDNGNVYFLASGVSTSPKLLIRRMKTGPESMEVPCPELVKDYNAHMNGADVSDQIRLQQVIQLGSMLPLETNIFSPRIQSNVQ